LRNIWGIFCCHFMQIWITNLPFHITFGVFQFSCIHRLFLLSGQHIFKLSKLCFIDVYKPKLCLSTPSLVFGHNKPY
jgi:hypothetical protein